MARPSPRRSVARALAIAASELKWAGNALPAGEARQECERALRAVLDAQASFYRLQASQDGR